MTSEFLSKQRVSEWAFVALFVILLSLLQFSIYTTAWFLGTTLRPEIKSEVLLRGIAVQMTAAATLLILLPPLVGFMNRFLIDYRNWLRRIPLHLAASIVFCASHMVLALWLRTIFYRVLGLKVHEDGRFGFMFLSEYPNRFLIYCLVLAIVSLLAYMRKNRERELREGQLEKQMAVARLNALKMQINPHFLFNTLNMISSYVHEDARTADKMIARLSDLLRRTLNSADMQEVPLQSELEFLEGYLEIMKARFQERLQVAIGVDPATRNLLVPHLILQPLVENSIKHCTSDYDEGGSIRLSASVAGNSLRLVLEDNGPGIPEGVENPAGGGIGLSNTIQRLQELYGRDHRFEMTNLPGRGFRIIIEIPARAALAEAG